jgi:hypothetical protein
LNDGFIAQIVGVDEEKENNVARRNEGGKGVGVGVYLSDYSVLVFLAK